MNNHDIEIVGEGNIGDRAKQLLEKTQKLREIGFYTPRRVVLAESFFDPFFQRNKLGNNLQEVKVEENLEEIVRKGTITRDIFWPLHDIAISFKPSPLVIRSSAEGDSRGTGIYKSEFCENNMRYVLDVFQNVLASYFSENAVLFRKDAKTGKGFGIIIEPIIGQSIETEFQGDMWFQGFCPILSGFGYTSTLRSKGYVSAVPGLGGGVDHKCGENLSRELLEGVNGCLYHYLRGVISQMISPYRTKIKRESYLLRTDQTFGLDYTGKAYDPANKYHKGEIMRTSLDFGIKSKVGEAFRELNLNSFFDMIDKIEELFGPQYFEWAMTFNKKEPIYWILQIADINKKTDMMDFEDLGDVIFMGHTVTGTGIKECNKIAFIWNPGEEDSLYEFNKENKDYVLIYTSRLTYARGSIGKMGYSYYNNASVFLELQDASHSNGGPVEHLSGQLDMTKKLSAVLDYDAEIPLNWDKFDSKKKKYWDKSKKWDENQSIQVYEGKVKAIASERQNKLVVSALD